MARFLRRKKKMVQKGVNAIFSGKSLSHPIERELEIGSSFNRSTNYPRKRGGGSRIGILRILVAILLIGSGLTVIGSGFIADYQPNQVPGPSIPGPGSPAKVSPRIVPMFNSILNIPEALVRDNWSYSGALVVEAGDFLVVQIAYSEGSLGNLPNISRVSDTSSNNYVRVSSASPGVGLNFWEQVWTAASSSSTSANLTVTPDWTGCLSPCVNSIIISMTIARYRNVARVGSSIEIAQNASSTAQEANVAVAESGSVLVELLSHGAYNSCSSDAAQPGSGQISRNCFAGSTERTEFFDRPIAGARVYAESYSWSQVEIQRGIYLELDGSLGS